MHGEGRVALLPLRVPRRTRKPSGQRCTRGKAGFTRLSDFVKEQIRKAVLLRVRGDFAAVEWHLFPSTRSGTLGPSKALIDELNAKGIPYVIHLP